MKIDKYKNFCGLQFLLSTALIMAINLGCINSLPYQSVDPTVYSIPTITNPVDLTPTQNRGLKQTKTSKAIPTNIPPQPHKTTSPTEDVIWELLNQVNIDRAKNDLRLITGEVPMCTAKGCFTIKNRLTGSEGLNWAKNYIYNELESLGYLIEFQDWSSSGYTDQNLIARKPGRSRPEEEIYFVAHLDGVKPGGEERYPAADDNASGIVDILELARVLRDYSFSRTIVLLFSTGEEQGAKGVTSYLSQLSPGDLTSIMYVIDIDVIGYDANQDHVMELWHGNHSPSFDLATQVSQIIQTYQLDLEPHFVVGCG